MSNLAENIQQPERIQYLDCGLDNVWIEGGFEHVDSPYGRGIAIHDQKGLHRCIARCLVKKPGALTGKEFRFLRTELDLSQETIGALFGRAERTVRDWETRDELVQEPENSLIRFIYEQRFNPSANFEEFSHAIKMLQALDKAWNEKKLELKSTESGWKAENCAKIAA
jgi:DNA-binding transcriptional regulator YiaG